MSRYTKEDDRRRISCAEGLRSLREVVNPDKAASAREQYVGAWEEIIETYAAREIIEKGLDE